MAKARRYGLSLKSWKRICVHHCQEGEKLQWFECWHSSLQSLRIILWLGSPWIPCITGKGRGRGLQRRDGHSLVLLQSYPNVWRLQHLCIQQNILSAKSKSTCQPKCIYLCIKNSPPLIAYTPCLREFRGFWINKALLWISELRHMHLRLLFPVKVITCP